MSTIIVLTLWNSEKSFFCEGNDLIRKCKNSINVWHYIIFYWALQLGCIASIRRVYGVAEGGGGANELGNKLTNE